MKEVILKEKGKTFRPFLETSGIIPRNYSLPLQRRVVDFGADVPFQDVPKKLLEHYGIELCPDSTSDAKACGKNGGLDGKEREALR